MDESSGLLAVSLGPVRTPEDTLRMTSRSTASSAEVSGVGVSAPVAGGSPSDAIGLETGKRVW